MRALYIIYTPIVVAYANNYLVRWTHTHTLFLLCGAFSRRILRTHDNQSDWLSPLFDTNRSSYIDNNYIYLDIYGNAVGSVTV